MNASTTSTVLTTPPLSDQVMIQMESVHKWYGAFHVLKDINLTAQFLSQILHN